MSKEENFIQKATEVHGGKYDYSKVEYVNSQTKVTIICPEHGEFEQVPASHLYGRGCRSCGYELRDNRKFTTQDFIAKASGIHGDKYDYSKVNYVDSYTPVIIICPIHGEFEQKPVNHIYSQSGCKYCTREKQAVDRTYSRDDFASASSIVHGDKYDYSRVEYINSYTPIEIVCPHHGSFIQRPNDHINGKACHKCSSYGSKGERELLSSIESLNYEVISNDRKALSGTELDIYIPEKSLAIEYCGLHWHSDEFKDRDYHQRKYQLCADKGIQLITIFEDEWIDPFKRAIVEERLSVLLGIYQGLTRYARKMEVKESPTKEVNQFMNEQHLQGAVGFSIGYGLYDQGELVACMTWKSRGNGEYELNRFAVKGMVVGAFSRLLKAFQRNVEYTKIVSFADCRWSMGDVYFKHGFIHEETIRPDYYYVKRTVRHHKFGFRKDAISRKFGVDTTNKTERQLMQELGYKRIYDCGKMKFVMYG